MRIIFIGVVLVLAATNIMQSNLLSASDMAMDALKASDEKLKTASLDLENADKDLKENCDKLQLEYERGAH